MYLIVETASRALIAMCGGDRAFALRIAKHHARMRGKPIVVRDQHTGRVQYTQRPEVLTRRKACDCPAKCYGAELSKHAIKCRPARPACKWRRKAMGHETCECPAYPFPHRVGSGQCGDATQVAHRRPARAA